MEIQQIENMYKINGLHDYRLQNAEDLAKVHGISFKEVNGYNRLDDINRRIYEKFIINIFNAYGLESRTTLIPTAINYVEEINFVGKEDCKYECEDDTYVNIYTIVNIIDRNGLKSLLHKWENEEYMNLKVVDEERKNYLRFEYKLGKSDTWLHVINEREWY